MYATNLFDTILLDPITQGADKLCVISGYATAAMAFRHLQRACDLRPSIHIELIVGMCPSDGLSLGNHRGFQKLVSQDYADNLTCSYLVEPPAAHSKTYVWLRNNTPVNAFLGSANYTQTAFLGAQREAMCACSPELAYSYFTSFISDSIYCTHSDAEALVEIYKDRDFRKQRYYGEDRSDITFDASAGLPLVRVSLLDKNGNLPPRSGLNWGQRPEVRREPNQAYIRLPAEVYRSGFFPGIGIQFTVLTDDGKILICSRAQQNGKAIHTPHNNSLIGEYFRNRLEVPSGALVTSGHLRNYGRSDVTFLKIDDETYYLDFSTS
ncbi:MAG: restriction endonuclease PLD domain-containing protein [Kiritimatiellales bacterium]|jgi:hypothetical protein